MYEIKLGKTRVEMYSSCKELPITRMNEVEKLSCLDLGIGSTTSDFNRHFSQLHAYLSNNKLPEAIQEAKNIHNNYFYMIEKIGVWSYSFLPFIKSINGKPYEGFELSECRDAMSMLSGKGLNTGLCMETIDELKKKLIQNLNPTFLIDSMKAEELTHWLN